MPDFTFILIDVSDPSDRARDLVRLAVDAPDLQSEVLEALAILAESNTENEEQAP